MRKVAERAVVVGGGPAGASAALALLAARFEVTVFERRPRFAPRVCGTFLDAEALRHLTTLGVRDLIDRESVPVRRVRVTVPPRRLRVVDLPEAGAALPRPRLEALLFDEIRRRGGAVVPGVRVFPGEDSRTVRLDGPGLGEGGTPVRRADLVVWATGRPAPGPAGGGPGHYGWNADFDGVDQRPGDMSLHFTPRGYVGVVTHDDGTTNVCGLYRRENVPPDWENVFRESRNDSPAFARETAAARRRTPWRGVGPLPYSRGLSPADGVLRLGDAAAVGDPFMGEGIGRALASGPMLVAALRDGLRSPETRFRLLWSAAYGGRFAFGARARRWILGRRGTSWWVRPLLWPGVLPRVLPLFHGGFRPAAIDGGLV